MMPRLERVGQCPPDEDIRRPDLLPLTPAQRGMWFADRLSPDFSVNIAHYVDIRHTGGFDIDLLEDCCHAAGRELGTPYTRLVEVEGVPMQYVDLEYDVAITRRDFRDQQDPERCALDWMRAEYRRPVDLLSDPLVAVAFLRLTDDRTWWYERAHHLVIDGYAALTTVRNTLDRYNALHRGQRAAASPVAALEEIVGYESAYADSRRRDADRTHWAERIRALPERTTLSGSHSVAPLSADNVVAGGTLTPETQSLVEQLARDRGSSPAVVLTAAFAAFLARMTENDDVVLSLPVTGRATAKIKHSGGMVSNILPIRLREVRGRSVAGLIAAAQLELTGALRHQRYRSEDIRRDAGVEDGPIGFGPTINMVFFDAPIEMEGADLDYRILTSGILEDLLLNLYQASPGAPVAVDLHGNPHLYSPASLDLHHLRFVAFLERFVRDDAQRVDQIALLLPGEAARLRRVENASVGDGPADPPAAAGLLADVLSARTAATPAAPALIFGERTVSYRDLLSRVTVLARELISAGVGPESAVAVSVPRSVELLVAVHAVWLAGGQYVPVETDAPRERAHYKLIASAATLMLVSGASGATPAVRAARAAGLPVLVVDAGRLLEAEPPFAVTERLGRVHPASAAYTIFTSGSTGRPKGVTVSQGALTAMLDADRARYGFDRTDVFLQVLEATFDPSVMEFLRPVYSGGSLVLLEPGTQQDPLAIADVVARRAVTSAIFVPSLLAVLVEALADEGPGWCRSLRVIHAGGESLTSTLAASVRTLWPHVALHNEYGPTETTIYATARRCDRVDTTVTIGQPMPYARGRVLDDRLRRVPLGAVGELYLGGRSVARGYVGRAGLTASRFIADPFGAPGDRLYRTGDRARWGSCGELEYLGRADFQVKVHGKRIELGEIEQTLLADAAVGAAVVILDPETQALVAYVRLSRWVPTDRTAGQGLRHWCARRLPAYMVPAVVMVLDEIPRTPAGKVDRAALPAPEFVPTGAADYVAPSSPVEKALVALLNDLLGRERIGVLDNVFHLGADSLTAARLAARAHSLAGLDLSLRAIFDSDSVRELAAAATPVAPHDMRPALTPVARPDRIPLSFAQTRLWFGNRIDPRSPIYNMPGAVRLPADADVDALEAAVTDLLARHESLRTRYPAVDGEPRQEIQSVGERLAALRRFRVTEEAAFAALAAEASLGFDVTAAPPVRFTLITIADDAAGHGPGTGHLLVVVLHHIAGDGGSLVPLVTDLLSAFAARSAGRAPTWDPLPVQYADYALWQRRIFGDADDPGSRLARELAFWTGELAGLPERMELPADTVRAGAASGAGDYVDTVLAAGTVAGIRALARSLGVTPFTVLHSALAILLARVAATDDVAIGTAVAGRDDPELAGLIGMFVNTVVLRTRVRPADTVADLLRHAQGVRISAMEHAGVPFEAVVDAVRHERSLSHSPLFRVALTMITDHRETFGDAGLEFVTSRPAVAKYDLTVTAHETPDDGGIWLEYSYATDLFERETVERLAGYLDRILVAMAADADRTVSSVPLRSAQQVADLTAVRHRAQPRTLRQLLAEHAHRADPTAPAVIGTATISNDVFEMRTNQLARELIARGAGPGDTVAVAMPRTESSVVAWAAIAKTGAAFVSVDPRHPAKRRARMLTVSGTRLGLSVPGVDVGGFPHIEWMVLDGALELHVSGRSSAPIDDRELVRVPRLDDPAYLIFTSGSTGMPKATMVPNRGLANLAANERRLLHLGPGSRCLHVASPSFDAAVFELLMALTSDGSLVVADRDTYAGAALERLIARHRVTHALMTPSALATLDPRRVPSLTTVCSGGEACPPELARRWAADGRRFLNLYGPTEVTVCATADGPLQVGDEVTIGRQLDGVGALVLDAGLQLTPDGVPGELYLTGDQLALGYRGLPGRTAGVFLADPYDAGARMYRTGDVVVRRPDGRLVYRGRSDFQLKVRGMRVEPGEVDAVLATYPGVANCTSFGVDGPAGETALVSYVSPVDGTTLSGTGVRDHAAERLPAHLVPSVVTVLDEFPLTVAGKIDRAALPPVQFPRTGAYVGPRNELEAVVAEVFGRVLGADRVGVHESFFDLGGTSLSAVKLAAQLSAVLDRVVTVNVVFVGATVAGVAAAVAGLAADVGGPRLVARPRAELVAVSDAQRGMWLMNQADPASSAFNISLALRFEGRLDVAALARAVGDLVARHEVMRTSYPMVGGRPMQLIEGSRTVLDDVDFTPIRVIGDPAAHLAEVAGRGFDVAREVPLRVAILELAEDDHVVMLVIHHISADGASMAPMARDFVTAYTARRAGRAPDWAPLRVQYADFTEWQRDCLDRVGADGVSAREHHLRYWRSRLADAPGVLDLPADRARPAVMSGAGAAVEFEIPAELVDRLRGLARSRSVTLFIVAHAALACLLARLGGHDDVVVGVPYAGRGEADLDDLVGMFVTTLPLRTEVNSSESFTDLIGRVGAADLADMTHADVSFDAIATAVGAPRSSAVHPVYQVIFAFQNIDFPAVTVDGLTITPLPADPARLTVDLQLTLFPTDPTRPREGGVEGPLRAQFRYATDLFDESTVQRYAAAFLRVLTAIADDRHLAVGEISVAADIAPGAGARPLGELVSAAATVAPEMTAFRAGDRDVSFALLTATASAMAGVLPDPDTVLVTAVLSLAPEAADPQQLDDILADIQKRAEESSTVGGEHSGASGLRP